MWILLLKINKYFTSFILVLFVLAIFANSIDYPLNTKILEFLNINSYAPVINTVTVLYVVLVLLRYFRTFYFTKFTEKKLEQKRNAFVRGKYAEFLKEGIAYLSLLNKRYARTTRKESFQKVLLLFENELKKHDSGLI